MSQSITKPILLWVGLCWLFVATTGFAATKPKPLSLPDEPKAMIEQLYQGYVQTKPDDLSDPMAHFDLDQMMAQDLSKAMKKASVSKEGELPILDWDIFVNGQDFEIKRFKATVVARSDQRLTVIATFDNFTTPMRVLYDFRKSQGRWRLYDMRYPKSKNDPKGFSLRAFFIENKVLG